MAGIWVPWLADAARLTGYPVIEVAGWRTRGHGGMTSVEGVLTHHTAGPRTGEYPSLGVVRDGRAGLAGPLSQLGLGRSGAVYVIAAGTAWHAGQSRWLQFSGLNSRFLGIEAESVGDGRDWTPQQLDCYPRLVAALLHYMRRDAGRAAAHREVAIPAGRKPDPAGIDMPSFRRRVAYLLTDPLRLIPRGAQTMEDPLMALSDAEQREMLELLRTLATPTFVPPGQDPTRPWSVSPGTAILNTYVAMFYGGTSTGGRSLFQAIEETGTACARLEAKLDELLARPTADVHLDAAAVRDQIYAALGGGLQISGVATPIAGTDTPATTEQGP